MATTELRRPRRCQVRQPCKVGCRQQTRSFPTVFVHRFHTLLPIHEWRVPGGGRGGGHHPAS
uniref:Uncharacterized protein n=1 Tax=Arundo donax TaxID=35708 RepID=A0A0A8YPN0_ARUDO